MSGEGAGGVVYSSDIFDSEARRSKLGDTDIGVCAISELQRVRDSAVVTESEAAVEPADGRHSGASQETVVWPGGSE